MENKKAVASRVEYARTVDLLRRRAGPAHEVDGAAATQSLAAT